ncbi:hypothetical protein V7x_05860 [Crateriforma conspicua]|uniref:DUF2334 domain-containing protein n=1 Tax=Crateriforma conspicua TaxID=2527996 RepID=A0A5C6FPK8_9PLAN|nr:MULTISPECIES: DUF2334 domain-containing protein [Crateriforma]TWU65042.1 hypothetical protein V7x_05860 [Crateriforma conspicua]
MLSMLAVSTPSQTKQPEAVVSIHDVMPSTMAQTGQLIDLCRRHQIRQIALLVVPGLDWSGRDVDQLRRWSDESLTLCGHGWVHQCERIAGWKHRLHSMLISRQVAEHLCWSTDQIVGTMCRCAEWFDMVSLPRPRLYVPPAWALGDLPKDRWGEVPFDWIETLAGLASMRDRRVAELPLVGFEADTILRKWSVRAFNAFGLAVRRWGCRPLRISIHPRDHQLKLADHLEFVLAKGWNDLSYSQVAEDVFTTT